MPNLKKLPKSVLFNERGPSVYVERWVDYSNKYGIGYTLTNGATGVHYNDGTKLILSANNVQIEYYERIMADKEDTQSLY